MHSKKIVYGLALMLLGIGCSKSKNQYREPADQRIDKKADPSIPAVIPLVPTGPGLGLVDGWYVEPTSEEEAKKLTQAIYSPIVLGQGLAGIDISMARTDIENKLGQPDYVAVDGNLRPVAVYGGGSFLIFYDRVTKNKVELVIAGNGYLGQISGFDLKVGSDLAPLLASEKGTEGVMKKLYQAANPLVEDCNVTGLCQALKGTNLGLLALTNTVQILFQDDPNKPAKNIFEIRITRRTPDAGEYRGAWSLDLLQGSLTNLAAPEVPIVQTGTSSWADVRTAGKLESLVEPRDFGRSLNSFGVGLSNDLSFNFSRSQVTLKDAKAPIDSDKLNNISTGFAYAGQLSLGGQALLYQMCKATETTSPAELAQAIVLNTYQLVAAAGGQGAPNGEPLVTQWLPSVVTAAQAKADCVQAPLASDLATTLTNAIQGIGMQENAEWLAGNTPQETRTLYIESLDGKAPIQAQSTPEGYLMGSVDPSLGFGKTLFNMTFKTMYEAAKAINPNTFDFGPSGFRSLEEKATFSQTLGMYDDSFLSGREISLSYAEASKALYFDTGAVSSEFANNNLAMSLLTKTENAYVIDLDGSLAVNGLQIASPFGPASKIELDPFDRSLRYAKISYAAASPVTDYAAYSERVVLKLTDGSSVVSRTQDVYLSTRGVVLAGKRVQGRSETKSVVSVDGMGFSGFPSTTKFLLTCGSTPVELNKQETFNSVYEKVKSCKKFLTPGYGANSVPYELHLAAEGQRSHALTLNFSEGLLYGFFVYNVN